MKRLAFDLMKRLFSKRLISIYCLIVEVLKDQNLFPKSNLGDWFSSYVKFIQVVISQNKLQPLSGVEK